MEGQLLWVLVLQLLVILLVAISILVFLLKKLMGKYRVPTGSKTILVTGADTQIGAQIATHLASLGFRVFAGVSPNANSKIAERLKAFGSPWLHVIPLDVTNTDSLAFAIKSVRDHFHAGEKGLWAVLHLAGGNANFHSGSDEEQLRSALEINVVAMLRLIRICLPHLSSAKGRFIILGMRSGVMDGLGIPLGLRGGVITASRFAAEGLAKGLRAQLRPHGVPVISLQPDSFYAQRLNELPRPPIVYEMKTPNPLTGNDFNCGDQSSFEFLSSYAMREVEEAILSAAPEESYLLTPSTSSRIKSMMITFSPRCVTNAILKPHKFTQTEYIHTTV